MASMVSEISVRRRLAILGLVLAGVAPGLAPSALAQDTPASAWRVECAGDGKSLDCRAPLGRTRCWRKSLTRRHPDLIQTQSWFAAFRGWRPPEGAGKVTPASP